MTETPQTFGVYAIINTLTGALYVGSTTQPFAMRWSQHRSALKSGAIRSRHLLNAWRKYGAENFVFTVLEETDDPARVLDLEEKWFQHYKQAGVPLYNHRPHVKSQLGMRHSPETRARIAAANRGKKRSEATRQKLREIKRGFRPTAAIDKVRQEWDIVSPDGDLLHITDLKQFCEARGLNYYAVWKMLTGRQSQSQGWTAPRPDPTPFTGRIRTVFSTFRLIAPDGAIHETANLEAFCRNHDLDPSVMRKVFRGRFIHHKGWRSGQAGAKPGAIYIRPKRTWPDVTAPDGTIHHVTVLYAFCKTHGLDKGAMQRVIKGSQRNHKGWHI